MGVSTAPLIKMHVLFFYPSCSVNYSGVGKNVNTFIECALRPCFYLKR